MVAIAVITSHLMENVRYQAKVAGHRERRATMLYLLSKEMAESRGIGDCMGIAVRYFMKEFGGRNVLLLANDDDRIVYPGEPPRPESLRGAALGIAQWTYDHEEPAGKGTNTLTERPGRLFSDGVCRQDHRRAGHRTRQSAPSLPARTKKAAGHHDGSGHPDRTTASARRAGQGLSPRNRNRTSPQLLVDLDLA
jgi:K+-sensing histidine kinase KdpD